MDSNRPPEQGPLPTAEALVTDHASAVLGVCLAWTRSRHDAEDAMQETLLKAIAHIDTLRDPSRVRPWLVQIARRVCLDQHGARQPVQPLPDTIAAPSPRWVDPRIEQLHAVLQKLPEDYREVISLYYLDGRNTATVAQTLGLHPDVVRQRLARGRLMLHERLKEVKP